MNQQSSDAGEEPVVAKTSATTGNFNQTLHALQNTVSRLERGNEAQQTIATAIPLLRLLGYFFLVFEIFDFTAFLMDAKPMDPQWEWGFATFAAGQLPALLLCFICILLGGPFSRGNWERWFLGLFRLGVLLTGIAYLLMIPLSINNLNRLYTNLETNRVTQLAEIQRQSDAALSRLNLVQENSLPLNNVAQGQSGMSPDQLANMHEQVSQARASLIQQANTLYEQGRNEYQKKSIIVFGYLTVAVIAFVTLFLRSGWIRECRPAGVRDLEGASTKWWRILIYTITDPFVRLYIGFLKTLDFLKKIPWIIQMELRLLRNRFGKKRRAKD